jgi:intraflagellar transport protein 122
MESPVRFIKVIGGPVGREGILIGLKSGHVFQIFVDSPFPVLLIKQTNAIRCLDISANRQKIAVVDENQTLFVYNIKTGYLLFQEPKANSVAWNTCYEDMLAYSGDGNLSIVVSNFPPHKQRLQVYIFNILNSRVYLIQSIN